MARIGVFSPSSVIGRVELELGVEKLESEGHSVQVADQATKKHLFFAGTDQERAQALVDFAYSDDIDVVWAARGGYGGNRTLREVFRLVDDRPKPPSDKLLVGFSDVTQIHEYVAKEWGWSTLHAPMVAGREFTLQEPYEWQALMKWVGGKESVRPWARASLRFVGDAPERPIEGRIRGGNLKVWESMIGTRLWPKSEKGDILFFEEISETPSKIDRILEQLAQAEGFNGISAVILGEFLGCDDRVSKVLRRRPDSPQQLKKPAEADLKDLREVVPTRTALEKIFTEYGARHGFAVLSGLPVGHGSRNAALPLNAHYRITPDADLELLEWSWIKS